MNKKKLCATLTLSAFAASLLPGMAFAVDPTPINKTVLDTTIELSIADATWLNEGDEIKIEYNGNDQTNNFTYAYASNGKAVTLTPKTALLEGQYNAFAKDTAGVGETEATEAEVAWTITVKGLEEYTFDFDTTTERLKTTVDTTKVTLVNTDKLYTYDGTQVGRPVADATIDTSGGVIAMTATGKPVATYAVVDANKKIKAYVIYPQSVKDKIDEAAAAAEGKLASVLDAIPAAVQIGVQKGTSANAAALNVIKNNPAVAAALDETGLAATIITIKSVDESFGVVVNPTTGNVVLSDKDVTGVITYNVGSKEKAVTVTISAAQPVAEVVKEYIAKNFTEYDATANKATMTMKKGDAFDMAFGDVVDGEQALKTNNKVLLTSNDYEVDKYLNLGTGEVIAAPAEDYKTSLTLAFADKDGAAITGTSAITIDLTIAADVPSEFDPTEDFTKEELEALDEAQLAEVKEVADQAKADALAARNAKAEAAVDAYEAQGLDLSKPEDLAKATELYLSYSAERKAYKEAKAYAALVDDVIAAGK